ncbi:hypothetical protein C8F04DRAFT_1193578 [Mycena alexandri]|uniref:Uncharacterized protein n=1 Tax=Mycena alexandri TaxID=1745969 RepID=A0AAD6S9E4_9AGAR|nr:hypothetical protein C8F04DRAFT_1193578 [Mycena alexandri]
MLNLVYSNVARKVVNCHSILSSHEPQDCAPVAAAATEYTGRDRGVRAQHHTAKIALALFGGVVVLWGALVLNFAQRFWRRRTGVSVQGGAVGVPFTGERQQGIGGRCNRTSTAWGKGDAREAEGWSQEVERAVEVGGAKSHGIKDPKGGLWVWVYHGIWEVPRPWAKVLAMVPPMGPPQAGRKFGPWYHPRPPQQPLWIKRSKGVYLRHLGTVWAAERLVAKPSPRAFCL